MADERLHDQELDRFWDAIVDPSGGPVAGGFDLDPATMRLVRRFQDQGRPRPPDAVRARVRRHVLASLEERPRGKEQPVTQIGYVDLTRPAAGFNGRIDAPLDAWPRLRLPAARRRWLVAQAALAALLIIALLGIYAAYFRDANQQAAQPTPIPAPTVETGVPMYRANPARTGVMPGPGPQGEPVELWRVQFRGRLDDVAPPVVVGSIAYLGSLEGAVVALDASTGRELWRFDIPITYYSAPAVADGLIYVCGGEGDLVALDAATGAEHWRVPTDEPANHLVADGVIYLGEPGAPPRALDAATGVERWRADAGIAGVRGMATADGVLFVAAVDGKLHALDAASGAERWTFQGDANAEVLRMPAVADGVVYLAALADQGVVGGRVYALDAATGAERWRFAAPSERGFWPVAVGGGTVYAPNDDGSLYALDAATGAQRWRFATSGELHAAPALVGETLYVLGRDQRLYAIDAATGAEQWRFSLDGGSTFGPVVVGGVAYLGTSLGLLVAIGGSEAAPAS